MFPNSFLGPSEANLEFNSTVSDSKDSYEALRDQKEIIKYLVSGGAPAQNPFSPPTGNHGLHP